MNREIMEILIGKYIDSEITPAEQRLLDKELQVNQEARQTLHQYKQLHDQVRAAMNSEINEHGKSCREIFDKAWEQRTVRRRRLIKGWGGLVRFTAGMAAGLALGLSGYFLLPKTLNNETVVKPTELVAENTPPKPPAEVKPIIHRKATRPRVLRNVDWYNFTDDAGDQWWVQGVRENAVSPAVYHGDL